MLVLYVALFVLLALVQVALRWRVGRLERRFIKVAAQADALLKQSHVRTGNNRADPFVALRQQHQLTQLALKRDRVESRYAAWQSFTEAFARLRAGLFGYKGKVLPYAVGALDVALVFVALDKLNISVEQVKALLSFVG
jgi:hypothetical protein